MLICDAFKIITKMADEDEIDVLGDFSFNSCFAQNNQGIPSCSNREDTVHPQWFLDSTANNWYDIQSKNINREKDGHLKRLPRESTGDSIDNVNTDIFAMWNQTERALLVKEMEKYGRNIRKISETIKTKTEAEIQALIEAEYGVNLDIPTFGLDKHEDHDDVPAVVQEEIVTDDTVTVTSTITKKPFRKKTNNKYKQSLLKPSINSSNKTDLIAINPSELFYEEDLIIGSTESIGSDVDLTDIVSKNIVKQHKGKVGKKIGNHRRKVSRNYDKTSPRNKSKDLLLKSPQGRQRKDSSLSEDNTKSPKMQIVLGSGQALPVSEGEQVIKIEKKKDSDPESDIDIDVDSDREDNKPCKSPQEDAPPKLVIDEAPIAVPLRKLDYLPKRQKKINLESLMTGGGGCTIRHTAAGDVYEVAGEPRRRRAPPPVPLLACRRYGPDRPAPFTVLLHVSALINMDVHAHMSRGEVMGLLGGGASPAAPQPGAPPSPPQLLLAAYSPASAAASHTHCDMEPVSQAAAAAWLAARGLRVAGWHHSHPAFPAAPSREDLRSQRALQRALERPGRPFLGVITSQHWPVGRQASQYRCIRVEEDEGDEENPVGYQLSARLVPDLTTDNVPTLLEAVRELVSAPAAPALRLRVSADTCPQANLTYLDKCISSVSHHMRSAGYADDAPVTQQLLQGIRDVLR